jgi:hypothetical protein
LIFFTIEDEREMSRRSLRGRASADGQVFVAWQQKKCRPAVSGTAWVSYFSLRASLPGGGTHPHHHSQEYFLLKRALTV